VGGREPGRWLRKKIAVSKKSKILMSTGLGALLNNATFFFRCPCGLEANTDREIDFSNSTQQDNQDKHLNDFSKKRKFWPKNRSDAYLVGAEFVFLGEKFRSQRRFHSLLARVIFKTSCIEIDPYKFSKFLLCG